MEYNTVIFDLDGTLLDTLDDLHDSVNITLEVMGFSGRSREEIRSFVGEGYILLLARALPDGIDSSVLGRSVELFKSYYSSNLRNKTKPYKGIPELLKKLKKDGIKIGVVSNKADDAVKESCRQFFGENIDYALGANSFNRLKPEADNVFMIMSILEADPKHTVYVGDSDIDVKTARNAGLTFVGVDWGFRSPQMLKQEGANCVIGSPSQILDIVQKGI